MDPFGPRLREGGGLRAGIVVEDGRGIHFAAQKANGLTVFQVDGGIQDHGGPLCD